MERNTAGPHILGCARVGFAFCDAFRHSALMTALYAKPFLTLDDQIELLRSRGLVIDDEGFAKASLLEYGYYRISGYSYPLRKYDLTTQSALDQFREGACIEHPVALIEFDRRLRSLFMAAAERIEIAIRVQIAILLGARDPWAHRDNSQFFAKFAKQIDPKSGRIPFNDWISRLDDLEAMSKEQFAVHFRERYNNPPPVWVSIELWDFGMLSKLVGGLVATDQYALGKIYGLNRRELLPSWVRAINHIRNIAAHHSRLWNRSPADQPSPVRVGELAELDHLAGDAFAQVRLYGVAAVTQHLLKRINSCAARAWADEMKAHFATFPEIPGVPATQTGFPTGWESLDLWN